jgi:hypothetical protein
VASTEAREGEAWSTGHSAKWPKLEHWRKSLQLEQLATKHWWPSLEFLIVIWICLEMSMTVLATHHFAFSLHDLKVHYREWLTPTWPLY